jgi:hypothetical protein
MGCSAGLAPAITRATTWRFDYFSFEHIRALATPLGSPLLAAAAAGRVDRLLSAHQAAVDQVHRRPRDRRQERLTRPLAVTHDLVLVISFSWSK